MTTIRDEIARTMRYEYGRQRAHRDTRDSIDFDIFASQMLDVFDICPKGQVQELIKTADRHAKAIDNWRCAPPMDRKSEIALRRAECAWQRAKAPFIEPQEKEIL